MADSGNKVWLDSQGRVLVDDNSHVYYCEECPCEDQAWAVYTGKYVSTRQNIEYPGTPSRVSSDIGGGFSYYYYSGGTAGSEVYSVRVASVNPEYTISTALPTSANFAPSNWEYINGVMQIWISAKDIGGVESLPPMPCVPVVSSLGSSHYGTMTTQRLVYYDMQIRVAPSTYEGVGDDVFSSQYTGKLRGEYVEVFSSLWQKYPTGHVFSVSTSYSSKVFSVYFPEFMVPGPALTPDNPTSTPLVQVVNTDNRDFFLQGFVYLPHMDAFVSDNYVVRLSLDELNDIPSAGRSVQASMYFTTYVAGSYVHTVGTAGITVRTRELSRYANSGYVNVSPGMGFATVHVDAPDYPLVISTGLDASSPYPWYAHQNGPVVVATDFFAPPGRIYMFNLLYDARAWNKEQHSSMVDPAYVFDSANGARVHPAEPKRTGCYWSYVNLEPGILYGWVWPHCEGAAMPFPPAEPSENVAPPAMGDYVEGRSTVLLACSMAMMMADYPNRRFRVDEDGADAAVASYDLPVRDLYWPSDGFAYSLGLHPGAIAYASWIATDDGMKEFDINAMEFGTVLADSRMVYDIGSSKWSVGAVVRGGKTLLSARSSNYAYMSPYSVIDTAYDPETLDGVVVLDSGLAESRYNLGSGYSAMVVSVWTSGATGNAWGMKIIDDRVDYPLPEGCQAVYVPLFFCAEGGVARCPGDVYWQALGAVIGGEKGPLHEMALYGVANATKRMEKDNTAYRTWYEDWGDGQFIASYRAYSGTSWTDWTMFKDAEGSYVSSVYAGGSYRAYAWTLVNGVTSVTEDREEEWEASGDDADYGWMGGPYVQTDADIYVSSSGEWCLGISVGTNSVQGRPAFNGVVRPENSTWEFYPDGWDGPATNTQTYEAGQSSFMYSNKYEMDDSSTYDDYYYGVTGVDTLKLRGEGATTFEVTSVQRAYTDIFR